KYRIERIENKEVSVYDVAVPVMEGIAQVGTIHVGVRLSYLRRAAKATAEALIIILLISSILGILVALIIASFIVRPIDKLTKATLEISRGNLSARIKVSSKDEVGSLGVAFNQMAQDMSKYQQELIAAKDYADSIVSSMLDALVVIDPEGKILIINQAASGLLGYKEDELIGKPATIIFEEEDEGEVFKDVSGKLDEAYVFTKFGLCKLIDAGAVSNLEMNYKSKSGEKIPVSFSGSVIKDKTGRLIGVVGVAKDMREIKRLMRQEKETAIAKAEANVERQKAKELKEAYKQLQELQDTLIQAEKLNAIGQLASGVAHEVKNPLGIIMQSVEYLEGKLLPSEKHAPEALRIIKNNIKRADNIIRVLLDFSRVSKLERKPEDINSILENSLVLIQHRVTLENIKIIRELGKGLPHVLVDKSKLEQVFINIFLNALQVMPEGGSLFIRTYQAKLSKPKKGVGAREEDYFRLGENVLMVEIEDTGAGIPPENLKKIFDPFFTTKDQGEGTGLGLSVTRNILIMHKGLIEIESQLGRGTKVIITLKISDGGKNG
ncbi:MAG: ATP-binding protein, partial [Candidatus Omnitrophota bacterium]|nr:ATP-binding protein [Candidatus Omnitrophota bacterium]